MRKKFTMLLASLFLTLGAAWAQSEFVKVGKPYTLNCKSGDHKGFLHDDGTKFLGKSDTPTLFIFEAAGDGKVYIKSEKTNKYLNAKETPADGGEISYDDEASTAWTIGSLNGGLHFSAAENLYLNNASGTNSLQIKQHNPIGTGNTCSLWNVKETIELTTSEDDIKWYTIKNVRCGNYVYHNGDGGQMVLKGLTGASRNAGKFYFTGARNEDGSLFTVKVHNAATTNLCKEYNSWDENGIDWYIQFSGNTANPGFAISKENNLTSNDYSWNDAGGNGTSVAYWNGNDPGSTWEFVSVEELELPEMSTMENPSFYYIRNVRHYGKYANYVAEGSKLTQVATPGLGSYWYFVAVEETAPEGWIACKIYNAANAKSLQNPSGTFNDAQVYYIKKHEWSGNIGFAIKRSTTDTNSTQDGWNDAAGSGQTIGDYYADDLGSIWWIEQAPKTAAELKSEAATALTNAQATIALYGEADYFTYPADAVAAAKAAIEGLDVTSSLAAAVSGHMAVNTTLATLQSEQKNGAPAVGDYIRMKNRDHNIYIYATDNNKVNGLNDKADTKTLWLVGGTEGAFKLKNFVSQTYISAIRESVDATMVDEASAGEFTFSNVGEVYASVKTKDGGDRDCANFNTWNGGRLLGWTDNGDLASHWVFSQAYPLTVVYKYNDEELTESGVSTFVDKGETYIVPEVTNTQAEFLAIESCTINEEPLEAKDGVWSVTVTQNTTIEVTLKSVATVTDLSALDNRGIYTLEAERSPLMYSTTEGMTTKLSSGMVDGVSANVNDINQQFAILRTKDTPENYYYLYSLGADKFVDANLNFTDTPAPVLSFEAYTGTNSEKYPWWVKISDKYVITGNNGEDGNKIYHIAGGDDDEGKRYRIGKVGDMDIALAVSLVSLVESSENVVRQLSELDNNKVYTVTAYDGNQWYYNNEQSGALWSTGKNAIASGAAENVNHFAFLTVNGKTYLYSVGAQKFVVKSADNSPNGGTAFAAFSDVPTHSIDFITSNNAGFPVVVKFNGIESGASQLHISTGYNCPVILYNDPNADASQVRIFPVDTETPDLSSVIATIENYQMNDEARGGLEALITEATTKNAYLENASLSVAITAAQDALDKDGATYNELMTAKENLAAALNSALYVTEINGFSNNYVYTFVSQRGWMVATDANTVKSADEGAADNALHQWAVYKSANNNYYLYNIGKQEFMGFANVQNEEIPFAATPQMTTLTFKKSSWEDYPIMFSVDNVGAVNNNDRGAMIYWNNGWNNLQDGGNNHKVTIVGKIESSTLNTIAAAVELYETQGVAVQALDAAIAAAQAKVAGMGEGLGYYSTTNANAATELDAIKTFRAAITTGTTVADINAQTEAAEAITATFTVNLPETGKFYRFSYDYGGEAGVKYVQAVASNVSSKANGMLMSAEQGVASIFYYADDKLLSYSAGQYVSEKGSARGLQTVGSEAGAVSFAASTVLGKLYIYADNSFHANQSGGVYFVDHCDHGHNPEHNFTVEEVTTLPVTVTAAGWGTFYTPVAVTVPNTVTAYTITAVGTKATLTEVTGIVPAGTGLILEGEGAHDFAIATEDAAEDFVKGLLQGSTAKTYVTAEPNTTYYVLAKPEDAADAGLYKAKLDKNGETAFLNGANKVYLPVTTEQGAPAMFAFTRGDEENTTGIESVELGGELVIYDLAGRRVAKMEKGIYIVNGKKVVIK